MAVGERIIRVFPRRTKATPDDADVRTGPPGLFDEADRVEVSVTFTWDMPRAEELARQWEVVAPVSIGGPATGMRGEEFVPGRYLHDGYVITSRGCPNRCWFCSVWKREGTVRELPIRDGWNVQDDNLLACSEPHIRGVFAMLKRQKHRAFFGGGLEAARLDGWHVDLLADVKPEAMYFAYDTPDDLEPLSAAGKLLADAFPRRTRKARAFILCGYKGDTQEAAVRRMMAAWALGFWPYPMVYQAHHDDRLSVEWKSFKYQWACAGVVHQRFKLWGLL